MLYVVSVFDVKVGAFMPPFSVRSKGEAVRSFQVACEDTNLPFKKHPEDFALFHVGHFNDNAGLLIPLDAPERLIGASEF